MKNLSSRNKILILIIAVIIIVGIIMTYTKGINKSIEYSNTTKLELSTNEMNIDEIKNIAKEVFGEKNIIFRTVGDSNEKVSIEVLNIQNEKLDEFKEKINTLNKGETEEEKEVDVTISPLGNVGFKQLIKPYIKPIIISTAIIIIYMAIKYRKYGIAKQLIYPVIFEGIVGLTYYSILVICNIPIGIWTMPLGILIYAVTMMCVISKTHDKKIVEEQ